MTTSKAGPAAFYPLQRSPFTFDLRAVGVFRILLALTILFDQAIRMGDWDAFHSASGLVSLADSRTWDDAWLWSVYWLSDGPWLPYVLEALRFVASIALLLGIRSRLAAFTLFVLLASVAARNPLLLQGGDRVLVVTTFFAAFLPLGQRFSMTRLWFGESAGTLYRSAATFAFAVQILLVWFMSGVLKTGEQWWSDGTAISMALHLEAFTSEFARLWRPWDWLLQPMTLFVFWLECLAPFLLLAPVLWCRVAGLVLLAGLEVGIWLSLEVGLFPLISVVSLVPLVPHRIVDAVADRLRARASTRGSGLVLFYDRDCRFCAFACRLLLAWSGIRNASLREAQSDAVAAHILEESFAWSVVEGSAQSAEASADAAVPAADYRRGWEAVRFLVARSPRPWIGRLLPGLAVGARLYAWIGGHRGALGAAGAMACGRGNARGRHGEVGRFVVSAAILVVLAWNTVTYPALHERRDLRPLVEPLAAAFNLKQYWSMFAPHPYANDFWHVMPALRRDGSSVDLLSGMPVSLEPPRDGPDRYGGYRWRKTVIRSLQRGEIERVFRWHCRTGRWAAFDLWEFTRPNLGVAATAETPYSALRSGRWQCGAVDPERVAAFRRDVDAMMEPHLSPSATSGPGTTPAV